MQLIKSLKKRCAKKSANITYSIIMQLYDGWYKVYKKYQKAELDGNEEELENLYYQIVDYSEYIREEQCNMVEVLSVIPANELAWHDLYWKKMNKFDDVMDSCERKRRQRLNGE